MRVCLARARPIATGLTASRWLGFDTRWMRSLLAAGAGKDAGRADVILHVSAAENAAGIDVLESGEDFGRRTADNVDDDVEASAMAHGQHCLLGAVLGSGVQDFVEQRNQRSVAFQRIALGADVARVDGLFEDVGANQLVEHPLPVDGERLLADSIYSWIQRRRSGSAMCMNSAPMLPQ